MTGIGREGTGRCCSGRPAGQGVGPVWGLCGIHEAPSSPRETCVCVGPVWDLHGIWVAAGCLCGTRIGSMWYLRGTHVGQIWDLCGT